MKKSCKLFLSRYAKKHDLEWHDTELGVGIGFADGCDVFWLLPGEAHSTYACPANKPIDPKAVIAAYEKIDRVRGEVIHIIRHCLADNDMPVNLLPNGEWVYEEDHIHLVVHVGPSLTRTVKQHKTTSKVLISLWTYFDPCELPTTKQRNEYLRCPLPPENEKPITEEHKPATNILTPAKAVNKLIRLGALVNCKTPAKLKSLKTGKVRGKTSLTLHILSKHLKHCNAFIEDYNPDTPLFCLEFSDGFDCYVINPDPKALPQAIKGMAVDDAAQWFKENYLAIDANRSRALNAIWAEAAKRGWSLDALGLRQNMTEYAYLGGTHREIKLFPGLHLSNALTSETLEDALSSATPDNPEFAKQCARHLQHVPSTPGPLPPIKNLPPDIASAPHGRDLLTKVTEERINEYDNHCQRILDSIKQDALAVNICLIPNTYNPKTDVWCTADEWHSIAENALKSRHPLNPHQNEVALRVMFEVDPKRADEHIRLFFDDVTSNLSDYEGDEFPPVFAPILWRYRHDYPKLAKKWLDDGNDQWEDPLAYAEERATLNDPVAKRFQASYLRDDLYTGDDEFPAAEDAQYLTATQLQQFQAKLIHWARNEHRCSPLNHWPLYLAIEMGWKVVGDALSENPWLAPGLLTIGRRPHGHDSPGILHASKLVLAWSSLAPGPTLAKILLTARQMNLVDLAMESDQLVIAERQAAERIKKTPRNRSPQQLIKMVDNTYDIAGLANTFAIEALLTITDKEHRDDSTRRHYSNLLSDVEKSLAIAWTRCKPYL